MLPELKQSQIDLLRILLSEKQQELETQLAGVASATKPVELDQQSVGRVSRIDAIQQQQMALANQQQTTQLLQRVESALRRVDNGEYGYCLQCEEPVGFARLQAQPFAGLCLECQSASESV
ncbi:MAG: TraR/DksA family transcriptional regulator [Gammaproteobacteria bacterium]|nr:TraR/DksA family transcriptional regulator [Gammaproteobacteria bacterium]